MRLAGQSPASLIYLRRFSQATQRLLRILGRRVFVWMWILFRLMFIAMRHRFNAPEYQNGMMINVMCDPSTKSVAMID